MPLRPRYNAFEQFKFVVTVAKLFIRIWGVAQTLYVCFGVGLINRALRFDIHGIFSPLRYHLRSDLFQSFDDFFKPICPIVDQPFDA